MPRLVALAGRITAVPALLGGILRWAAIVAHEAGLSAEGA
ncbi:hypothetical protein SAMN04489726_2290 [Allokutzneria albata]|uniref:Uncharacterized protein n=1 Tax=Allokutzneria albata TaxID=211114 RepID=A0A1G9U9V3_ALLAB|nr:hypothetical protein SAMN04489726_2290 [Allokutzneria albata]